MRLMETLRTVVRCQQTTFNPQDEHWSNYSRSHRQTVPVCLVLVSENPQSL